ncbi:MAG: phage tail tube protein [Clostridia bacterium]|nr:phage tail tube protein [Clostridia bacterium]
MATNITMNARDAIAAKLAKCFFTINGNRYNFANIIDLEAKLEKDKATVPRLGAIMKGHKSCGMEGTFSGTMHYNQSVLRKLLEDYKNTGEDVYFEIQIENDDPTSAAESQSVILYDCNTDGGILAKFDADGEYLDEEIEGTFEDFSIPETFTELDGFLMS